MSDEMNRTNFQNLLRLGHLACLAQDLEDEEDDKEEKRIWVRDWIAHRKDHIPLFRQIETEDREKFFADFRLYPEHFDLLLSRCEIKKKII